jgi:hypothetical protein
VRVGLGEKSVTKLSLKLAQNGQERSKSENRNRRYLTAGEGIYLNFLSDSESTILFFKTAGFRPSALWQCIES